MEHILSQKHCIHKIFACLNLCKFFSFFGHIEECSFGLILVQKDKPVMIFSNSRGLSPTLAVRP